MADGLKRTELRRRTPMKRAGFKTQGSNLKSKPTAKPKARRDTGPSKKVRDAVLGRDRYRCQRCGHRLVGNAYSLQHRLPRGRLGKNTAANLVAVCGSATTPGMCHDWMEHVDRPQATLDGWLVPSWDEVVPENWAVKRFDGAWAIPGIEEWVESEPHPKQLQGAA